MDEYVFNMPGEDIEEALANADNRYIPEFTIRDVEALLGGGIDKILYDYSALMEAMNAGKIICVWDSRAHTALCVASYGIFRSLEICNTRYYSIGLVRLDEPENGKDGAITRPDVRTADLITASQRSPYIIRFSLSDVISGREVIISRALLDAAYLGSPVIIKNGSSYLTSTYTYAEDPNEGVELHLRFRDPRQEYSLVFSSREIIPENGSISIVPEVQIIPAGLSIVNSTDGEAQSVDNVMRIPAGFFSDKSVGYSESNELEGMNTIIQQITLLERPLTGDGQFVFPLPTRDTAVEYIIKFDVGIQCSWFICDGGGNRLRGNFYGKTLTNITPGVYLMKITLFTYVSPKGNAQTDYIAEVMTPSK